MKITGLEGNKVEMKPYVRREKAKKERQKQSTARIRVGSIRACADGK